jgi:ribosome maturation factor RimP
VKWALGPFFVSGVPVRKWSGREPRLSDREVKNSVNQVAQLVSPTVEALGLQLWGIEHTSQGKYSVLRIFIERETGVTIEDCEQVSRQVSAILDVEDPIAGEYTLEVSSPGTDRLLFTVEQFQQYCGEEVDIRMRSPLDGRRKFKGILQDVVNGIVQIEVDGSSFELPHEEIEKANIVY